MAKITVRGIQFIYDEELISFEEAENIICSMLYKTTGSAHPTRIQKTLEYCARIRSDPRWQGSSDNIETKELLLERWRKERMELVERHKTKDNEKNKAYPHYRKP